MNTNSTSKLIGILESKQIGFENGEKSLFRKYSYYQVVNAYKNIFVSDIEHIHTIRDNIKQGKNIEFYRSAFKIKKEVNDIDLYERICDKICEKYGLNADTIQKKEEDIKQIKYHLHRYSPNVKYGDFVRMYKFEHELRLMLLKYTLIIEESMKNIFISYLNDKKAKADYLVNMNNYNTSSIRNKAFDTMKLVIGKYDNLKSKPIKRKRDQNITVPYWIIINELAMNQTYYAIANLKKEDSDKIFLKCTNFFTELNISENNRGKSSIQIEKEKSQINMFKTILCYLGEFRNMLAHNQPIYCYNIDLKEITPQIKFEYEFPKTNNNKKDQNGNKISKAKQQISINADLMRSLADYFGQDKFNNNNYTNLDLSKIIYIIYKILKTIDKNTRFYEELRTIYLKYNIILNEKKQKIENVDTSIELLEKINQLEQFQLNNRNTIEEIVNGKPYKQKMISQEKKFNEIKKSIVQASKKIRINTVKSKYKPFSYTKRYTQFTGIDHNFFNNIL